jgi:hypothetical protein
VSRAALLFVCALSALGTLSPPSLASAPSPSASAFINPQVASIDQQITSAQQALVAWETWLEAWGARIDRAQRDMEMARLQARALAHDLLRADQPRAAIGSLLAADVRLTETTAQVRRIETSRQALTGEQNVQSWVNYLASLMHQRTLLMASPPQSVADGSSVTYASWAGLFLKELGAPICSDNLIVVITWEAQESTAAAFNPLATTWTTADAGAFNSAGVKNYPSLEDGLQATVDTLELGSSTYLYGPVLQDLGSCASASMTAAAINASAWCRGCAGGAYATGLLPEVQADPDAFAQRLIATPV